MLPITRLIHVARLGALALAAAATWSCDDPRCPIGYLKIDGTCYRMKDAGAPDAGDLDDAADDRGLDAAMAIGRDADVVDRDADTARDSSADTSDLGAMNDGAAPDASTSPDAGGTDSSLPNPMDPCQPSPCGPMLECIRGTSGGATCVAACSEAEGGCQPGDPCAKDEDCQLGGGLEATCHPSGHVCVNVCRSATIVSEQGLDALKFCSEIEGDLRIEPTFASIDADDLPYLTRVRGNMFALGGVSGLLAIETLAMPELRTVDGQVNFSATKLSLLNLPRLTSAGSVSLSNNGSLTRISLPQLAEIKGDMRVSVHRSLERIDLGRLTTVADELRLTALCKLPWAQVQPVASLGASQVVSGIGCCNTSIDRFACPGDCVCN